MQDRLNVAFLCHPYHRGGVTRWMMDMAMEYVARNVNVYFVTVEPEKDFLSASSIGTIVSLLRPEKRIQLITTRVNWLFELGTEMYRASVYEKLLLGHVPAGTPVILSDDPAVWRVASLAGSQYNFIGVLHSDESAYYKFAQLYHKYVGALVCVSDRIRRKLQEMCRDIDPDKVSVIPCGIEMPANIPEKKASAELRLVFVGRINEYPKRVSDLLKICAELVKEQIGFKLTIIGDGADRKELEAACERMGLSERVLFAGWLSKNDIYDHLFRSDILLLTSDFEGMPIVVMEAFSTGCGVVSTRVSGVEDYEKHPLAQNCLWLYPVGDIAAAIAHIKKAISIPVHVRSAGAMEIAEKEFSMNTCMLKYNNVIRNINKYNADRNHRHTNWFMNIYSLTLSVTRYVKYHLVK